MRYHLTPIRMVIKMAKDNKCWEGWERKDILTHCWWRVTLDRHYGKQHGNSLKEELT
jgi:hypothetical protein